MGGARFAGLSLAYFHSVQVHLAPSSSKLRRVLPFFTPKSVGELVYTASPPPPKKAAAGGSPTLHLSVALAAAKADGSGAYDEKLAVVYTDGTALDVELGTLANANEVLQRIQRHAKVLQSKDEALAL